MSLFAEDQIPQDGAPLMAAPREATRIIGHSGIEQRLVQLVDSGTLPHGLIFAGPRGIGKATMAHRLAKFLLTQALESDDGGLFGAPLPKAAATDLSADPHHPQVRLYLSGAHPDCLLVERTYNDARGVHKDALDVDQLRAITPFLRKTASEGGWRIVLIDDADTMNRNAQNALLKILEEPPARTLLILIAHRPGALLPTIQSRTQTLRFDLLSPAEVQSLMPDTDPRVLAMAHGSPGEALALQEQGGLEALEQLEGALRDLPAMNWIKIHKLTDTLSRRGQDQAYTAFTAALLRMSAALPRAIARKEVLPDYLAFAQPLVDKGLHAALDLHDQLTALITRCDYANLDKKQTLLACFDVMGK